jgi:hypothetical protein
LAPLYWRFHGRGVSDEASESNPRGLLGGVGRRRHRRIRGVWRQEQRTSFHHEPLSVADEQEHTARPEQLQSIPDRAAEPDREPG